MVNGMKQFIGLFLNRVLIPFRKSLRVKLTAASFVVMLLTVVVITVFGYMSVYTILKDKMSQYLEDSINKANENLDMLIRDADRINAIISVNESKGMSILKERASIPDYTWFSEIKTIDSFLASVVNTKEKVFTGIAVIGTNGEIFRGGSPQVRENTVNETWFKKILEARGQSVVLKRSVGQYGVTEDSHVLSVGRAIMRYGEIKGIVVTDIDISVLNNIYDFNGIPEGGVFIFNEEKEMVFRSLENDNLKSMSEDSLEELLNKSEYQLPNKEISLLGNTYISAESKSAYSKWTTLVLVPKSFLLKDFYHYRNSMIIILLIIVVIVLQVLPRVIGKLTKNIKELMKTMEEISLGNIDAKPSISSVDEIGKLSEIFVDMMEKVQYLMEDIKVKEQGKRKAELEALQAQINPHFLCNTLNTIKYLAHLQNVKNISELTTSLVRLLRITIDKTDSFITIEEELEHVKSYLTIQSYKYADRFSTSFEVQEGVLKYKTIKMILQPLVENAIFHGIEPSGREGVITIKVFIENEHIKFKVIDNGIGMSGESIEKLMTNSSRSEKSRFSGIGVNNVSERIKLFFGTEYGINVYSQPGMCTSVEVNIPIVT